MVFLSEMNDSILKSRITYDLKGYLKNKNKSGKYEELKEIVLRYYDFIKQYIIEEITERDLIMQDNKMIRHDLDIESHVDFEKIRQSIYTKSNKGLSFYEKNAKIVMLLNAVEMINIYGIEELKNNQQNIEKEIYYGSFLDRKMKKSDKEIETYNKIGDMYGKESIKYFKDIFLLEERINSLLSYNCTTQEREKLKDILNRLNKIIDSLPKDIILVLQLRIAKIKINEKFCRADNCWMDYPDIDSLKKVKDVLQKKIDKITENHKRVLERNSNRKKSGFELEIEDYNTSMKKINYYQEKLNKILNESQKNDNDVAQIDNKNIFEELKNIYTEYCQINREMLINRLYDKAPSVINSADEYKFMLVHFPTSESAIEKKEKEKEDDDSDGINLANRIMRVLRAKVAKQNNRKYNRKKDRQSVKELYKKSRDLFDFTHRIPVKIQYRSNSLFLQDTEGDENPYQRVLFPMCLTKPTTNISMTAANPGRLKPHRDRKIGYGCLRSSVSPESIYSIDSGFNLHNDVHTFEEDEYPISELNFGTQETMADWTKIKPDYIVVIKETKDFENSDIYMRAKKMSEQTNLPLVIYDQYEITRKQEIELIR